MLDLKSKMQEALESSAVLKMKLITLRGRCPSAAIFAFEGVDDKSLYYYWIKQVSNNLNYVPFFCGGKRNSFKLMESLNRDANELWKNVYFCVDRDFDENIFDSSNVYVTSKYSFENFLACKNVLEEILKHDFNLHGHPEIVVCVCDLYDQLERRFFAIVQEVNLLLFVAAKLNIRRVGTLPTKISSLANLSIDGIESRIVDVFKFVDLERNPNTQEIEDKRHAFDSLNPRDFYRGKFNFLFFKKFLNLIYDELRNPSSDIFKNIDRKDIEPKLNLTLDAISSKSTAPECFSSFIKENFEEVSSSSLI